MYLVPCQTLILPAVFQGVCACVCVYKKATKESEVKSEFIFLGRFHFL